MTTVFDPADLGRYRLNNRIVMSPMTRARSHNDEGNATASMATYYAQRASAGLIITEGIWPVPEGKGYPDTPGLSEPEHVASWRVVTDAVHAVDGRIFAQLMHTGRIGHPTNFTRDGLELVGASAVTAAGKIYTHAGMVDYTEPRALTEEEILATIAGFAQAARNAIDAGFDGVEIHGANGYLPHQFLSSSANLRDDAWGGSIDNRVRFTAEVAKAVSDAIGADRVGLRISPANPFNDISEENTPELYRALIAAIAPLHLAYLHIMETPGPENRALTLELRDAFEGPLILNPATPDGVTGPDEVHLVEDGVTDFISFGALFISNPDLPARLAKGSPFNEPKRDAFYAGDDEGYIDYPALEDATS